MDVILKQDDIDRVDGQKRIGVAIFPYNGIIDIKNDEQRDDYLQSVDCIERVYGDNEQTAWENAKDVCAQNSYQIVCEM